MRQEAKSIITQDSRMKDLLSTAQKIAASKANVLIQGAGGSGKQLFAEFIHQNSSRANSILRVVSCTTPNEIPAAVNAASGGTLVLDDINVLEPRYQIQLLGMLQEQVHDVRIISVTTENLDDLVQSGRFRQDLAFYLKVIRLQIPSLEDRKEDIPLLAEHFVSYFAEKHGVAEPELDENAVQMLSFQPWKGNVRELENVIERAVVSCSGETIRKENLDLDQASFIEVQQGAKLRRLPDGWIGRPLAEVEREMIYWTLTRTNGNRTHAARMLGISIRTLRNKLSLYRSNQDALFVSI